MTRYLKIFNSIKCAVIGMIHTKALPGTPRSYLTVRQLVDLAVKEAFIYKEAGIDGVIVENMHDVPFVMGREVGPEVTAAMTRICTEVKKVLPYTPCGVQVLSGNNFSATAVALAADLQFVRAESYVFAHIADEGYMQACAGPLKRYARNVGAEHVLFFTDIKKKHSSHAITSDVNVAEVAKAADFFLSDGVILTGTETGDPPDPKQIEVIRKSTSIPILIGSGVTVDNIQDYVTADALIVGSHFKQDGHWSNELDPEKITKFMEKIKQCRGQASQS